MMFGFSTIFLFSEKDKSPKNGHLYQTIKSKNVDNEEMSSKVLHSVAVTFLSAITI